MTDKETKRDIKPQGLVIEKFPSYFLIACLFITGLFLFNILYPFLTGLVLAAILATAFHPLYHKILALLRNRERWASLLSCFLILVLLVVPLVVFILLLSRQALNTFDFIKHELQAGHYDQYLLWAPGGIIYDFLNNLIGRVDTIIDVKNLDIKTNITNFVQSITSFFLNQAASIINGFLNLLLTFFVMFFAMYYFFKDGHAIIKKIMVLSPLPEKHEVEVFRKFKEISLATLYGIFLTSIVQGIIGGIGFAIVGIPNVLFWGTAIAVFSLIPFVGTSVVWFPAGIILLLSGNYIGGIFLLLWGAFLVSTVDNFLRAFLIGGRTKTNQLLTFLAIFGSIWYFESLVGVIFGPLILALFFTFLHIYEMEYNRVLHHK